MRNGWWLGVVVVCGLLAVGCATLRQAEAQATLDVNFSWSGTTACSPEPPAFTVKGVPEGTAKLIFRMQDLDVPAYNHGGGTVPYTGQSVIPAGAFRYRGPCPPSGSHRYRFTVKAVNAAGDTVLGVGTVVRDFPPDK